MRRRKLFWASMVGAILAVPSRAQEFQRINGNIGGGFVIPLSGASAVSKPSGHFVLGAGANVSRHFGVNSEFQWLKVPIKQSALDQAGIISSNAAEISLTLNGIMRLPLTDHTGVYVIGGGGWYHRFGSLILDQSGRIPVVVCGTLLSLLGINCIQATIPSNQVPAEVSSNAFGGSIGAGIAVGPRERGMKFYAETRYHHAAHSGVNANNLLLTFGVRW